MIWNITAAAFLMDSFPAFSSTPNMEVICSSETSACFRRTTRRNIPQERTLHNHRCGNLKFYDLHILSVGGAWNNSVPVRVFWDSISSSVGFLNWIEQTRINYRCCPSKVVSLNISHIRISQFIVVTCHKPLSTMGKGTPFCTTFCHYSLWLKIKRKENS